MFKNFRVFPKTPLEFIWWRSNSFVKASLSQALQSVVTYGGGSIKNNGVYYQVSRISKRLGLNSCIEPKPSLRYFKWRRKILFKKIISNFYIAAAVAQCWRLKFIAAARYSKVKTFGISWVKASAVLTKSPTNSLRITLPGNCSEVDTGAVVTRNGNKLLSKARSFGPIFAILDPAGNTVIFVLTDQIGNGVWMSLCNHGAIPDLYKCKTVKVQDRLLKDYFTTLVEKGQKTSSWNVKDYRVRWGKYYVGGGQCAYIGLIGEVSARTGHFNDMVMN